MYAMTSSSGRGGSCLFSFHNALVQNYLCAIASDGHTDVGMRLVRVMNWYIQIAELEHTKEVTSK